MIFLVISTLSFKNPIAVLQLLQSNDLILFDA